MHRSHSKLNGNRLILFMLIILSFNINISDPLTIHLKCHIIFSVGRWKLRFFNDFLCLLTIVSDFLTTRRWIDIHSRKAMIIQQCRNRNFAKYNTGTVRLQRQLNFASVCNFSTLSWFWDFWGSAEEATRQHHIDAKMLFYHPFVESVACHTQWMTRVLHRRLAHRALTIWRHPMKGPVPQQLHSLDAPLNFLYYLWIMLEI